jgi:pre-mRNA-processing factor 19
MTGAELDPSKDLVAMTVAKASAPKPLSTTSVPSLLQSVQNEWDSVMLEVFQLRKSLDDTRKELSHALYQHDAACKVICRLLKEKEQLQDVVDSQDA